MNTHLHNYIEENFRSKYDATMQASNWLSAELEELRIKVEKSEDARIAYERENQIWQIDEKQDITTQKLADLSKAVTEAQTDLAEKEALYRMAAGGSVDALPAARTNDLMGGLLKRESELDELYAEALDQYGPNFPKVLRLQAQQKQNELDLNKARQNMVASLKEDYDTASSRVELLQEDLDKQKAEANDLAEKLVQYHILQHDAESNKQLYDGLQQKLKEATITVGLHSDNIRIVDPALVPASPSRPQKARNILLAFLVGLVGGIGLALFREYLDNTVKSPDDVEALTGLPSLAVVPSLPGMSTGHNRLSRNAAATPRRRAARRIAFVRSTEIADLRGVPRVAHFAVAFASRSSATSDSGDERAAAGRKDHCRGESGCDAGATGRPHAFDRLRHAQTRHPPRIESHQRQRSRIEFVSGGRFDAR